MSDEPFDKQKNSWITDVRVVGTRINASLFIHIECRCKAVRVVWLVLLKCVIWLSTSMASFSFPVLFELFSFVLRVALHWNSGLKCLKLKMVLWKEIGQQLCCFHDCDCTTGGGRREAFGDRFTTNIRLNHSSRVDVCVDVQRCAKSWRILLWFIVILVLCLSSELTHYF